MRNAIRRTESFRRTVGLEDYVFSECEGEVRGTKIERERKWQLC